MMRRYWLSTALQCIALMGYYILLAEVVFVSVDISNVPAAIFIEFIVPLILLVGWFSISGRRNPAGLTAREKWNGLYVRLGVIAAFLVIGLAMELSAGRVFSIGAYMLHNFMVYLIISGYAALFALAELIRNFPTKKRT